ncbi:MAG: hypothetical protein IJ246_07480 [Clostridia bacterium]|nr:hypothetical protein [Clostridia bacterium]
MWELEKSEESQQALDYIGSRVTEDLVSSLDYMSADRSMYLQKGQRELSEVCTALLGSLLIQEYDVRRRRGEGVESTVFAAQCEDAAKSVSRRQEARAQKLIARLEKKAEQAIAEMRERGETLYCAENMMDVVILMQTPALASRPRLANPSILGIYQLDGQLAMDAGDWERAEKAAALQEAVYPGWFSAELIRAAAAGSRNAEAEMRGHICRAWEHIWHPADMITCLMTAADCYLRWGDYETAAACEERMLMLGAPDEMKARHVQTLEHLQGTSVANARAVLEAKGLPWACSVQVMENVGRIIACYRAIGFSQVAEILQGPYNQLQRL